MVNGCKVLKQRENIDSAELRGIFGTITASSSGVDDECNNDGNKANRDRAVRF